MYCFSVGKIKPLVYVKAKACFRYHIHVTIQVTTPLRCIRWRKCRRSKARQYHKNSEHGEDSRCTLVDCNFFYAFLELFKESSFLNLNTSTTFYKLQQRNNMREIKYSTRKCSWLQTKPKCTWTFRENSFPPDKEFFLGGVLFLPKSAVEIYRVATNTCSLWGKFLQGKRCCLISQSS